MSPLFFLCWAFTSWLTLHISGSFSQVYPLTQSDLFSDNILWQDKYLFFKQTPIKVNRCTVDMYTPIALRKVSTSAFGLRAVDIYPPLLLENNPHQHLDLGFSSAVNIQVCERPIGS